MSVRETEWSEKRHFPTVLRIRKKNLSLDSLHNFANAGSDLDQITKKHIYRIILFLKTKDHRKQKGKKLRVESKLETRVAEPEPVGAEIFWLEPEPI